MSLRHVHESAAARNAELARALQASAPEWAPTLIFYAGVQVVEAALADFGTHESNHSNRRTAMASHWGNAPGAPYKKLQQLSGRWRYAGVEPTTKEIEQAWQWVSELATAVGETSPAP